MKITSFFFKGIIIAFWLLVIALFLSIPRLSFLWKNEKAINLLTWAATIDPKIIADFEKKTGVRVNINYFDNNEELFVKLLTTKGEGYDLIMPSDYTVPKLIEYDLIKPLDKSKLNFWHTIDSRLLHCYFDVENKYTIPYFWAIYGIGVNTNFFHEKISSSWGLLFTCPKKGPKVAMLNTAREAMLLTAQFLYGTIENITEEKIDVIKQELLKQRECIETYVDADFRANYLLASGMVSACVVATPYIAKLLEENKNISFVLPQTSFILIDSLALSKATKKTDLVYEFLNYLYQPEILLHHFKNYPFFPVTSDCRELMEKHNIPQSIIDAHYSSEIKREFFKNVISESVANKVWMVVKTS